MEKYCVMQRVMSALGTQSGKLDNLLIGNLVVIYQHGTGADYGESETETDTGNGREAIN